MMHGCGKSDSPVVPGKPPNKAAEPAAEEVEGRGLAKGNLLEQNASRTQGRSGKDAPSALERVRGVARGDGKQRFTALLHQVYDPERLYAAYYSLKRDAAAGVDGETWRHYGKDLIEHLADLSLRLWRATLRRRSQRGDVGRQRMAQLASRWLPPAHICQPWPWQRFAV